MSLAKSKKSICNFVTHNLQNVSYELVCSGTTIFSSTDLVVTMHEFLSYYALTKSYDNMCIRTVYTEKHKRFPMLINTYTYDGHYDFMNSNENLSVSIKDCQVLTGVINVVSTMSTINTSHSVKFAENTTDIKQHEPKNTKKNKVKTDIGTVKKPNGVRHIQPKQILKKTDYGRRSDTKDDEVDEVDDEKFRKMEDLIKRLENRREQIINREESRENITNKELNSYMHSDNPDDEYYCNDLSDESSDDSSIEFDEQMGKTREEIKKEMEKEIEHQKEEERADNEANQRYEQMRNRAIEEKKKELRNVFVNDLSVYNLISSQRKTVEYYKEHHQELLNIPVHKMTKAQLTAKILIEQNRDYEVPIMFKNKHPIFQYLDELNLLNDTNVFIAYKYIYYQINERETESFKYYGQDVYDLNDDEKIIFSNDYEELREDFDDFVSKSNIIDIEKLANDEMRRSYLVQSRVLPDMQTNILNGVFDTKELKTVSEQDECMLKSIV